jgi:hypothetical protein
MSDEIQKNNQIYILTEQITHGQYEDQTTETKTHGAFRNYNDAYMRIVKLCFGSSLASNKFADDEPVTILVEAGRFTITPVEVQ